MADSRIALTAQLVQHFLEYHEDINILCWRRGPTRLAAIYNPDKPRTVSIRLAARDFYVEDVLELYRGTKDFLLEEDCSPWIQTGLSEEDIQNIEEKFSLDTRTPRIGSILKG